MKVALLAAAAALLLAACQTTDSDWIGGEGTSFYHAERTCTTQTEFISAEERRPRFFVGCMAALGWTPGSGSEYAQLATISDPT